MKTPATVEDYLASLPEDRKPAIEKLMELCRKALPDAQECISYGMIGYVVPHSIYPKGYHCYPKTPLPFISIASQKSHIAVYHMGIYMNPELLAWFQEAYPKHSKTK
jgi:uncharacterized protein YdhG (YjbR/CyaY superfamily)